MLLFTVVSEMLQKQLIERSVLLFFSPEAVCRVQGETTGRKKCRGLVDWTARHIVPREHLNVSRNPKIADTCPSKNGVRCQQHRAAGDIAAADCESFSGVPGRIFPTPARLKDYSKYPKMWEEY